MLVSYIIIGTTYRVSTTWYSVPSTKYMEAIFGTSGNLGQPEGGVEVEIASVSSVTGNLSPSSLIFWWPSFSSSGDLQRQS